MVNFHSESKSREHPTVKWCERILVNANDIPSRNIIRTINRVNRNTNDFSSRNIIRTINRVNHNTDDLSGRNIMRTNNIVSHNTNDLPSCNMISGYRLLHLPIAHASLYNIVWCH
jgi:hypothetical protein